MICCNNYLNFYSQTTWKTRSYICVKSIWFKGILITPHIRFFKLFDYKWLKSQHCLSLLGQQFRLSRYYFSWNSSNRQKEYAKNRSQTSYFSNSFKAFWLVKLSAFQNLFTCIKLWLDYSLMCLNSGVSFFRTQPTFRTRLKRLVRKTTCFSKSLHMYKNYERTTH